jgi:hypothetical protein
VPVLHCCVGRLLGLAGGQPLVSTFCGALRRPCRVFVTVTQGYLARLVALAKKQNVPGLGLRSDLVDLIDLLRVSSVEVVEAIVKWRRGLVGSVSIFLPSHTPKTPRTLASSQVRGI